jgi:hypothetical protein
MDGRAGCVVWYGSQGAYVTQQHSMHEYLQGSLPEYLHGVHVSSAATLMMCTWFLCAGAEACSL